MKFLASLLFVYFSFLMFQPSMISMKDKSSNKKCEMPCCKKDKQESHSSKNPYCDNSFCNPFALYACCIGFIPVAKTVLSSLNESENKTKLLYSSNIHSDFISNCWHPPKNTIV